MDLTLHVDRQNLQAVGIRVHQSKHWYPQRVSELSEEQPVSMEILQRMPDPAFPPYTITMCMNLPFPFGTPVPSAERALLSWGKYCT